MKCMSQRSLWESEGFLVSSSEVTDWPGPGQLQCHSCFKISGPAGWGGLAWLVGFHPGYVLCPSALCWLGFSSVASVTAVFTSPQLLLCSTRWAVADCSGRREGGAAVRSRPCCSHSVFISHTEGRRCCSGDSAFLRDGIWRVETHQGPSSSAVAPFHPCSPEHKGGLPAV